MPVNRVALAAAATMGIAYVVCAAAFMAAPQLTLQWVGWLFHFVNVDAFAGAVEITPVTLLSGFVQSLVYTYLIAILFCGVYNGFSRMRTSPALRRTQRTT